MEYSLFSALLHLLDDPDQQTHREAVRALIEHGQEIYEQLETQVMNGSLREATQERAEHVLYKIQYECVKKKLYAALEKIPFDWINILCILANLQYPYLYENTIRGGVDEISKDIRHSLNRTQTATVKICHFNHVFYEIYGFRITSLDADWYLPNHFYINDVLAHKKGDAWVVGILYLHLAREQQLPIDGLNLDNHLLLCLRHTLRTGNARTALPIKSNKINICINTAESGAIISKTEIDDYLKKQKIRLSSEQLQPCPDSWVLKKMLQRMSDAYRQDNEQERANDLRLLAEQMPTI